MQYTTICKLLYNCTMQFTVYAITLMNLKYILNIGFKEGLTNNVKFQFFMNVHKRFTQRLPYEVCILNA